MFAVYDANSGLTIQVLPTENSAYAAARKFTIESNYSRGFLVREY
jgi:hypothetical protein